MTAARGPLLVAVSGPADAGRSALVGRLAALLRERGLAVVVVRGHGCLLCRRLPVRTRVRDAGEPGGDGWARRATDPERRGSAPRRVHAFLEAAGLAARIAVAGTVARKRARTRGGQAVVVTERGPLDGLVTFDPPAASGVAGAFRRLAGRYHLTLLVDTGPDRPRGRDRADAAGHPAPSWARYRDWSRRLPRIARLDGERAPSLVTGAAVERIVDAIRERERAAEQGRVHALEREPEREQEQAAVHARTHAHAHARERQREQAAERSRAVPARNPARDAVRDRPDGTRRRHIVVSVYDGDDLPGHRGGGALVAAKVARRLAEDFRVTVVTAGRHGGAEERDGIRYVRLPVRGAGPRAGRLLFLALLPLVSRRIRHDLWLESFTPPFSTSFLPLTTAAPVVGIDQGRRAEALRRRYRIPFFLVERLGLRCYRHIVVTNTADGVAVRRLSPRADVQVITGGVEQRGLDETRLGTGQFILFLGRIDSWAGGLDLLLDAYDRVRPPLDLLLAGSGTPEEERRLADLLAARPDGTEPRIHWVGPAEDDRRRQLLRDSAFLVLPSRHETFGLTALEGMAYGKPVLHFDLPALRWMRDGGGVAVRPFDVAAFGERMAELAGDAALRRRLGRRAGLAARHYTWDETTGRYLALAHRLLDAPVFPRRPRMRGGVPTAGPPTGSASASGPPRRRRRGRTGGGA
ncbi:glycosyltransferase family 4 protein [Streptomyces wedmorensis]|uniref:D-inositol 3-phosphate glycosyltransferase n=1 Tax=Streptomyces wedmorensis TaxID=43759 RepID=A0ABW6IMU7_STRWE